MKLVYDRSESIIDDDGPLRLKRLRKRLVKLENISPIVKSEPGHWELVNRISSEIYVLERIVESWHL